MDNSSNDNFTFGPESSISYLRHIQDDENNANFGQDEDIFQSFRLDTLSPLSVCENMCFDENNDLLTSDDEDKIHGDNNHKFESNLALMVPSRSETIKPKSSWNEVHLMVPHSGSESSTSWSDYLSSNSINRSKIKTKLDNSNSNSHISDIPPTPKRHKRREHLLPPQVTAAMVAVTATARARDSRSSGDYSCYSSGLSRNQRRCARQHQERLMQQANQEYLQSVINAAAMTQLSVSSSSSSNSMLPSESESRSSTVSSSAAVASVNSTSLPGNPPDGGDGYYSNSSSCSHETTVNVDFKVIYSTK